MLPAVQEVGEAAATWVAAMSLMTDERMTDATILPVEWVPARQPSSRGPAVPPLSQSAAWPPPPSPHSR